LCDPMSFFDFYEKERPTNLFIVIGTSVGFLILGYIVFMIKNREKSSVMVYD